MGKQGRGTGHVGFSGRTIGKMIAKASSGKSAQSSSPAPKTKKK